MKNINNICLLEKNGVYESVDFTALPSVVEVRENEHFGCLFIQTNEPISLKVVLKGAGASCDLKCVYFGAENEQKSLVFDVTHAAGKTKSTQTVKGIVADKAKCAFYGTIHILPDAQKCEGTQNHRAVLLSDTAQVQATPELEIFADDVVCSHGSAIGPIDKNQLFYLLSRGIDEKTAYQLLLTAFLQDVLPADYHFIVREWLHDRL